MDTLTPPPEDAPARLPTRLIVMVFATIFAVLAIGYWFFLSGSYAPAFTGLRPAEASAVVGQLAAKNIPYRLQDGGTTILVPGDQVAATRVAIAGSDVPMKGGVGFELFNKSDMGLTDFAQRINYQRALQGELERSIMMLDDVETARVHLAMPERTLFRADRSAAKAAVELVGKDGRRFDEARVAGIQRLVAFAVPDLVPADVVVLDADGKVLSAAATTTTDAALTPEAEEQRAVSSYYRARIRAAVSRALPGITFDVKVMVEPGATIAATNPAPRASATPEPVPTPPATPRTFGLRITVATTAPLNAEERTIAQSALAASVGYDEKLGDTVSFEVGTGGGTAPAVPIATAPSGLGATPASGTAANTSAMPAWLYAIIAALLLTAVAIVLLRRRSDGVLSEDERSAMVARLRASLRDWDESRV